MTLFDGPGWIRLGIAKCQEAIRKRVNAPGAASKRSTLQAECGIIAAMLWVLMIFSGDIKIKAWGGWVITAAVVGLGLWLGWRAAVHPY